MEGVKADADTPIKKAVVQSTFADANHYMKRASGPDSPWNRSSWAARWAWA